MLGTFFDFLARHAAGIVVLFLSIMGMLLLLQWTASVFGVGRFGNSAQSTSGAATVTYLVADFFVKIINDFRHLLALIVMLIFATTLLYSLSHAGDTLDGIKEALQAVMATLGGLVGSVVGYYFGESAGLKKGQTDSPPMDQDEAEQESPPVEEVRRAPQPPENTDA